ncbi:AAA family ATPase [Halobacillus rhizosphaerae]|uniref:AAA family ATPase n=1 Tax=Halobacillus rhizosphaerae TaxID=3064889 RepID=UPI00398AA74D
MIKNVTVKGLNGDKSFSVNFNEDINIITGRNGAGKTTLLKLLWYTLSGNIMNAIDEINFDYISITDEKHLIEFFKEETEKNIAMDRVNRSNSYIKKHNRLIRFYPNCDVTITRLIDKKVILDTVKEDNESLGGDVGDLVSSITSPTIFFPTFRRIEGGFSTSNSKYGYDNLYVDEERLQHSIRRVANKLTNKHHKFITSISTVDIVDLITKEYANISEEANENNIRVSREIEQLINSHTIDTRDSSESKLDKANMILGDIKREIRNNTLSREELFKPFTVLNEMINKIFQHKSIKVTDNVTLGELSETKEAMFSDLLSAGEKQMLSFITYNAFFKENTIFIDEPEISLHVDWQRTLLPTLMSQKSNNQFIIATHSPFIYTKYVDKEIILNVDRGDSSAVTLN